MRNPIKRFWAISAAMILSLGLITCGGDDKDGDGGIERTDTSSLVTVYTSDKPTTLDPHATDDGGDSKILDQVFETLVRVDPKDTSRLQPILAKSWTVSEDGKEITITMREGVKFQDGSECNAEAAMRSLRRVAKQLTSAPYGSQYREIDNLMVKDDKLVIKTFNAVPQVILKNLSMFAASIISPAVLDAAEKLGDAGKAGAYVRDNPVGTGPFKVTSFSNDGVVTLEAFDDYWGGKPSIQTLVFRQAEDFNVRLEHLNKSKKPVVVDDVPRSEWSNLGDKLHSWWALNTCYLGLNTKKQDSALKDLNLRRAIQLAINREAIAEIYLGTAKPNYTLLPPTFAETDKNYRPADCEKPLEDRIAIAKKLVEASGLSREELSISLKRPKNPRPYLPEPGKTAELIKQQLAAIGITVTPEAVPNGVLFGSIKEGNHELVLLGWMSDNGDPDNFFDPLTGAHLSNSEFVGNENNAGRTGDRKVYEAINAAKAMTDLAKRKAAYQAIEADQQTRLIGYVPLVHTQQGIAMRGLSGVEIDGLGHYRFHNAKID